MAPCLFYDSFMHVYNASQSYLLSPHFLLPCVHIDRKEGEYWGPQEEGRMGKTELGKDETDRVGGMRRAE